MAATSAELSSSLPEQASGHTALRIGRWLACMALAALFAVHGWLAFRLFPSWQALTDDRPVVSVDHAIHLYHGYLGARFLKEHGTSWGYDPYFMAGYPKTPVYDSSSGPAELFQFMAGGVYSPRAYKLGVAVLVALVPVVIALAARAYGTSPGAAVAAVAWTVWYWWAGFPDTLVRTGLVAFVWSAALAVLLPALLVRWGVRGAPGPSEDAGASERRRSGLCSVVWRFATWLTLTAVAAAGVQAHSIFPLMVFVPVVVGYAWLSMGGVHEPRRHVARPNGRWHATTWGAVVAAGVLTYPWWWPLLRFLPLKTASTLFMTADNWSFIWDYYRFADGRIPALLLLFGVIGMIRSWRSGRKLHAAVIGSQIAVLALLTFAGSMWNTTRNLEPLRFQVPLCLALCIPAGVGLCVTLRALDPRRLTRSSSARLGWSGAAVVVLSTVAITTPATSWWAGGVRPERRPPSSWEVSRMRQRTARPLAVGLRPEMEQLVAWLNEHTDSSARILFEDQLRLLEQEEAESLHWTPLLPVLTQREFIGGLYHLAFIPHQRAAFGDWHLAGRYIRSWSARELRQFCDQYNIGWVVTWSRASPRKEGGQPLGTDVFASMPFCEWVATLPRHSTRRDEDRYTIFRVDREHTYFARGRGRVVTADYNRIELADLEPDAEQLVLRYHWQDVLRADPPVPIERADEPGDPVGFIRIQTDTPLPRLVLTNAY